MTSDRRTSAQKTVSGFNDPAEDMTAIFVMQRAHAGDQRLPMWHDFWTTVYQAIDD